MSTIPVLAMTSTTRERTKNTYTTSVWCIIRFQYILLYHRNDSVHVYTVHVCIHMCHDRTYKLCPEQNQDIQGVCPDLKIVFRVSLEALNKSDSF